MAEDSVRQRGKAQTRYAPNVINDQEDDKMRRGTKRKLCSLVVKVLVIAVILLSLSLFVIESPIEPVSFSLPSPPAFEGPLAVNYKLQNAVKILDGQIIGPESLERVRGGIITGLADGRIVKISKEKLEFITRLGVCDNVQDEAVCGRPLGMRVHKDGKLYVLDAYKGLFRVDLETGKAEHLVSSKQPIAGRPLNFLNDLDVAADDMIYFTDSSDKWTRRENRLLALESSATGRVLRYNPILEEVEVLMDGLAFPNGIQLSSEEDFILVCETLRSRIHKYYIAGDKAGTLEMFADNLPGLPDNIRYAQPSGYWVGMAAVRKPSFSMYDFMATRPWMRNAIAKLFDPDFIMHLVPKYGLIVQFDDNGQIVQSLHDPTGKTISGVSEVLDMGPNLYLGSYNAPFLARVDKRQLKQ